MENPKMRNIEAFPTMADGQQVVVLRDPFRYTDQVLAVNHPTYFIISQLNGANSIVDVQANFMKRFGQMLMSDDVQHLINQLDESYFLDNERFRAYVKALEDEYFRSAERPPALAGVSYEADPEKLRLYLDEVMKQAGPAPDSTGDAAGIVAPHIDIRVAEKAYAAAYREIAASTADLFVILGTAHSPTPDILCVPTKDFQTPLGTLPVDRDALAFLTETIDEGISSMEFYHRTEHSIEFQAVFLAHLFAGKRDVAILPVLCGSFHEAMFAGVKPEEIPDFKKMVDAIAALPDRLGKKVCYIAGADLAHMGGRFGDAMEMSPGFLSSLEEKDREMLDFVCAADTDAFRQNIYRDGNGRRVCGFPNIYMLLLLLGSRPGTLLRYDRNVEDQTRSVVSFAAVSFR